jgi:hypothetical protein
MPLIHPFFLLVFALYSWIALVSVVGAVRFRYTPLAIRAAVCLFLPASLALTDPQLALVAVLIVAGSLFGFRLQYAQAMDNLGICDFIVWIAGCAPNP